MGQMDYERRAFCLRLVLLLACSISRRENTSMHGKDDGGSSAEQDTKARLRRKFAAFDRTIAHIRRSVGRNAGSFATLEALQALRSDIAAFEMALINERLRHLVASATSPDERRLVEDLSPVIAQRVIQRSRRQGRNKWSFN